MSVARASLAVIVLTGIASLPAGANDLRSPESFAAISNQAELRKLGASCDEFACYDVEVCVDCRWNHLRRQSLHGRLHAS